jgi:twinkle protein
MKTDFSDLVSQGPQPDGPPAKRRDRKAGLHYLDDKVREQMVHEYRTGKPRGSTTHVPAIDKHFSWKPGDIILLTGWPNEGKTELLLQLMLLKSVFDGWRWALYMPENTPESEIYDTLVHALTGQPTDRLKPNCISLERYHLAMDFIGKHFVVVDVPEDSQEVPTLDCLLDYLDQAVEEFDIDGAVLDPWNQLAHDTGGLRTDEYLSNKLSDCKRFAKRRKKPLCFVITVHPNKPQGHRSGDKLPVPDAFLLNGGSMWNNKADAILAPYRPNRHISKTDPAMAFYSHKIKKQKYVGIPGSFGEGSENDSIVMTFDPVRNRHLFNGWSPLDHPKVQAIYAPELATAPITTMPPRASDMPASQDFPPPTDEPF